MSNLSIDKGLKDVFKTADRLATLGIPARLVLAGQPSGAEEAAFLKEQCNQDRYLLDYRGPVSGSDRERFFADIDIFLFPSVYRHEYTPLVLGESIIRGIPIVTRETICCQKGSFGRAGLVLLDTMDFATACTDWIEELLTVDGMWNSLTSGVYDFKEEFKAARYKAAQLARDILGVQ
jgi:glycosyltransferase involved in cell wall biosynthesis